MSPLTSSGAPTDPAARRAACAGTAPQYQAKIDKKYAPATRGGHRVVPLLHEVSGAIAPITLKFLAETAARARGRRMEDFDDVNAPWSAPTLSPYLVQSISIALQQSVADQVLKLAAETTSATV